MLKLLQQLVLPLAAVEDEIPLAVGAARPAGQLPSPPLGPSTTCFPEIAATLRELRPLAPRDRERTIGSLDAVDHLVPARLDGEEIELLASLGALDRTQFGRLGLLTHDLPRLGGGARPDARFHLPVAHAIATARLTDTARRACLFPTGGLTMPSSRTTIEDDHHTARHRIVPLALIAAPEAVALRFTLAAEP